jgi:hypothetical protein
MPAVEPSKVNVPVALPANPVKLSTVSVPPGPMSSESRTLGVVCATAVTLNAWAAIGAATTGAGVETDP